MGVPDAPSPTRTTPPTGPTEPHDKAAATAIMNERWVLKRHPNGAFEPSRDVQLVQEWIQDPSTCCNDEDVLVEVDTLSVDAFVRTMLDGNGDGAYHGGIPVGETLPALGYGRVVAAGPKSGWTVGRSVMGLLGAQTYASVPGRSVHTNLVLPRLLPKSLVTLPPPTSSLGLLGLTTGLTAYVGMFYVCRPPQRGETVVVTAAAGAVGSIAAQLAKTTGATVVGVTSGSHKCDYLRNDLNLDGAVNYKNVSATLEEQLDETCPLGVDFVFDNVGGGTLDALLDRIRPNGRVVLCGAVSQYDSAGPIRGPANYLKLAERGATMKGFTVLQYRRKFPIVLFMMIWLYLRGRVHMTEHIKVGIRSYPHALQTLFAGGNTGKLLVRVKLEQEEG